MLENDFDTSVVEDIIKVILREGKIETTEVCPLAYILFLLFLPSTSYPLCYERSIILTVFFTQGAGRQASKNDSKGAGQVAH